MTTTTILDEILKELKRAKKVHPRWPDHIVAQAGIVSEESGELIRACINLKYESAGKRDQKLQMLAEIRKEAVHTAATCLRFLENLGILEATIHNQSKKKHEHHQNSKSQAH